MYNSHKDISTEISPVDKEVLISLERLPYEVIDLITSNLSVMDIIHLTSTNHIFLLCRKEILKNTFRKKFQVKYNLESLALEFLRITADNDGDACDSYDFLRKVFGSFYTLINNVMDHGHNGIDAIILLLHDMKSFLPAANFYLIIDGNSSDYINGYEIIRKNDQALILDNLKNITLKIKILIKAYNDNLDDFLDIYEEGYLLQFHEYEYGKYEYVDNLHILMI